MKTVNVLLLTMGLSSSIAFADAIDAPKIYPFVPVATEVISNKIKYFAEDTNPLINIFDIDKQGLTKAKTTSKPWTSTYWPLNKGIIADPYKPNIQLHKPLTELKWQKNYKRFQKRKANFYPGISDLTTEELNKLAPSEKYDLLLGDKSFHLTNKVWEYTHKWGSKKEFGFLSSLDITGGQAYDYAVQIWEDPNWTFNSFDAALTYAIEMKGGLTEHIALDLVSQGFYKTVAESMSEATQIAKDERGNYELTKKSKNMATWEGICHGWSTASGIVPRPKKTVSFDLPSGQKLNFYPDDMKGLASMLWANSLIQDGKFIDSNTGNNIGGGVIMEGLRCNLKRPKRDKYGRTYDHRADPFTNKLEARCVGLHPAIWHLMLTNIIGKQGRSFIVERKVKAPVDNHPLYKYSSKFFNPETGDEGSLKNSIVTRKKYGKDPFKDARNKDATSIVGVELTMTYMQWVRPSREEVDSPSMDETKDIKMMYDLELDSTGNIIGGQWRASRVGKPFLGGANPFVKNNQPDFAWVVTKDWKGFFQENTAVSEWKKQDGLVPPADWAWQAQGAHNFKYFKTKDYGWNQRCTVKNKKTDKVIKVPCEYIEDKPQPLVNVVNRLIELAQ